MPKTEQNSHEAVFIAGYEKGRADGIALAQSVWDIAISHETLGLSLPESARCLLPGNAGRKIADIVKSFHERAYRAGRRDEKNLLKAKAAKAAPEAPAPPEAEQPADAVA